MGNSATDPWCSAAVPFAVAGGHECASSSTSRIQDISSGLGGAGTGASMRQFTPSGRSPARRRIRSMSCAASSCFGPMSQKMSRSPRAARPAGGYPPAARSSARMISRTTASTCRTRFGYVPRHLIQQQPMPFVASRPRSIQLLDNAEHGILDRGIEMLEMQRRRGYGFRILALRRPGRRPIQPRASFSATRLACRTRSRPRARSTCAAGVCADPSRRASRSPNRFCHEASVAHDSRQLEPAGGGRSRPPVSFRWREHAMAAVVMSPAHRSRLVDGVFTGYRNEPRRGTLAA
jgi:hypothetical protein